ERRTNHAQHHPPSPGPARPARAGLSSVPRSRREGQVASPERIHRQDSPRGRSRWRLLQDVVQELHHGSEPLLWRAVRRIDAARAHSLYGQIRRSQSTRRDGSDHQPEEGFGRDRAERHSGRRARCHSRRGLLSWLAGVAHAAGEAGRGGDARLVSRARISSGFAGVGVLLLVLASVSPAGWYPVVQLFVGLALITVSHVLTPCQDQLTRWWNSRVLGNKRRS